MSSQESRCHDYAESKGYAVEAVFPDDVSGGGDFMARPGMVALISFLKAQKGKNYTIIFDDLKRFARDTEFHIKLRRTFRQCGPSIECLNFKFEDSPEGEFIETIIAAQSQLERQQNRRQVIQKMKARMQNGYWVFPVPVGYKYVKSQGQGKMLVPDEPLASILIEAVEGFAADRFSTPVEVKRFLETRPEWPNVGGHVRQQKVTDILTCPLYTGYIDYPDWGLKMIKGQHAPLISLTTFQKNQEKLAGRAKAPTRKDINADFPLRGFVLCADCNHPMTSCWSKGRTVKYPYYLCDTKGCPSHRKSIRREKIEGEFEGLMSSLTPTKGLYRAATAMFKDLWEARLRRAQDGVALLKNEPSDLDKKSADILDRVIETTNPTLSKALEERLEAVEQEKRLLIDRIENAAPPKGRIGEVFEPAMQFLANPWKI